MTTVRTPHAPARASFPALGGTATVLVTDGSRVDTAVAVVRACVAAIDATCSRFRADSELSALNARAGRGVVTVSPLLSRAIGAALRAAELTDGDVDPTVGPALAALGYDRDFDAIPASANGTPTRVRPAGWRAVRFDPIARAVELPAGAGLDLGATAKALAADLAATAALEQCGGGVLVSLSGDIAIAGEAPVGGWSVRVTDDHREPGDSAATPDVPGQSVAIRSGGLATSSTTVRTWRRGGRRLHHLVDPRTGDSARTAFRTASIAAGSCLEANIAATATLVRGLPAIAWLTRHRLPARLVREDHAVTLVAGWPRPHVERHRTRRSLACLAGE
jgi:thiamine biosynthesis lipoprotein